jgi:hypothetical protein
VAFDLGAVGFDGIDWNRDGGEFRHSFPGPLMLFP